MKKQSPFRRCCVLMQVTALLLGLTACGGGKQTATIRIGVALYQQDDTFISTVVQNLEQAAREKEQALGVKINLNITDGQASQSLQNEQVDRFLTQGYDIVCVNIVDRTAAAVLIDKAKDAGVPVIFFNREPVEEDLMRWEGAYYVGAKAEQGGRLQGQIVLDAWQGGLNTLDRNRDGILQYVMLEGEPDHQDALLRTEYSVKVLTQAGVSTEKLANETANWQRGQAKAKMLQLLERFGERIEVVFANNDDMALGAIDACLEAGLTAAELPFIVGVDATPPALEAVREGTLKGTVVNDADNQARAMLALSCTLAQDESPDQAVVLEDGTYVWLAYTMVTEENLDDFISA